LLKFKTAESMTQAVGHLSSKNEALSSDPSTTKRGKCRKKRRRSGGEEKKNPSVVKLYMVKFYSHLERESD
jgi:hypothetical protein